MLSLGKLKRLCWWDVDITGSWCNGRVEIADSTNTEMPNFVALMCEHPVRRVGLIRNTRHYTRVRRQTIQLIMWCNVFIISSLPFPSLDKLSNLTSQPYFRFRATQNLKIDHSYCSQVENLFNVLSSELLFIDDTIESTVFGLLSFKNDRSYTISPVPPSSLNNFLTKIVLSQNAI